MGWPVSACLQSARCAGRAPTGLRWREDPEILHGRRLGLQFVSLVGPLMRIHDPSAGTGTWGWASIWMGLGWTAGQHAGNGPRRASFRVPF